MGALDFKKQRFLLAIATIALLTRESFWIYLLALSLLNYKKIFSEKSYLFAFIWLWAIPLLWIASVPFAYLIIFERWPQWPIEWPLMINRQSPFTISALFISLKSLGQAIAVNKIPFLITGLAVAWLSKVLYFRSNKREITQHDPIDAKFKVFSLTSLAIIYFLVVFFNPWEHTYGNMRMGIPLIYHLFVWVLLFYKETFDYPKVLKIIIRSVLILSLLSVVNANTGKWFTRGNPDAIKIYSEIEELMNNTYRNRRPSVCIVGDDYWESLMRFIAPTLYMKRKFVMVNESYDTGDYDIIITPSTFEDNRFLKYKEFRLGDNSYTIYIKPPGQG